MKAAVLALALVACGGDGPSCKDAVTQASRTMYGTSANRDRTAMMIGTCEQDSWSVAMRSCVAAATVETELAGCFAKHRSKRIDHPDAQHEAVARIEGFTEQMCACPDKTCADRVQEQFTAWGTEVAHKGGNDKPDAETTRRIGELVTRYTECMTRVMTASLIDRGPELLGVSPARGDAAGGTYVVLKGQRFLEGGPRSAKVYFGARQGMVVRFASNTELIVEAPGGIAGENVDIRVVFDPGGQSVLANAFTFSKSL